MERWRNGDSMRWAEISAPEVTYVDPYLAAPIVGLDAYTDRPHVGLRRDQRPDYAKRDGSWRIVHTRWSLIGGRVKGATP